MKFYLFFFSFSVLTLTKCPLDQPSIPEIMTLPYVIDESSGLAWTASGLYTVNDSGDGPMIYRIDTTNKDVSAVIKLERAKNKDWEDLAYDASYLYIADTGNNLKKKKKMQLYAIHDTVLQSTPKVTNNFLTYEFRFYDDQGEEDKVNCEAMAVDGNMVYFISKEKKKAIVYGLDLGKDEGRAFRITEVKLDFQITGLEKIDPTHYLATGYVKKGNISYSSVVYHVTLSEVGNWTNSQWDIIEGPFTGQCEAVAYDGQRPIVSTEGTDFYSGKVFYITNP